MLFKFELKEFALTSLCDCAVMMWTQADSKLDKILVAKKRMVKWGEASREYWQQ